MRATGSLDPLALLTALAAGLVSFASPCVLPLVPAYLGLITGRSAEELRSSDARARLGVSTAAISFVCGLAVIFAALGASASLLGETLLDNQEILWRVGGVLVIVFGLHTAGILRIPLLYRTRQVVPFPVQSHGWLGAFTMGIAFGAGWTPCTGPFLASLLTLAGTEQTVGQGALLLLVYGLGLGLPFLGAGVALDRSLVAMARLKPHLLQIERFSGVVLVGMGVLLLSDSLALISGWFTRIWGNGLAL